MVNKYIIESLTDITAQMKAASVQGDVERTSTDAEPRGILKFIEDDTPAAFAACVIYTHAQVLTELANAEWSTEE